MSSSVLSNYSHLHQKCVCEMCNCGKHHCPKPHLKGDYHTCYQKDYPRHEGGSPTQTFKKVAAYQPSSYPNELQSNYQAEYVAKEGNSDPRQTSVFTRNGKSSIAQDGRFQGESAYNNAFKQFSGNYGDLRAQVLKRENRVQSSKFEGESSYVENFMGTSSPPAQQIKAKGNLSVGQGKFDGESTYNKNYIQMPSSMTQKVVQRGNLSVGEGKFDALSNYNQNFQGTKGVPAQKIRAKDQIALDGSKFNGQSTYNRNYTGLAGTPPARVVNRGQLSLNTDRFESGTTYNTNHDYKGVGTIADVERPRSRKDLIRNDNKSYNGQSSYAANYQGGVGEREQQVVRKDQFSVGYNNNFEGESHYTNSYKAMKPEPSSAIKPKVGNSVLPVGNFQGESSYTSHYIQTKGSPSQQIRQRDAPLNNGAFEGNTTYGDQYHYKASQKVTCPVDSLNPPRSNDLDQQHVRYNARLGVWV